MNLNANFIGLFMFVASFLGGSLSMFSSQARADATCPHAKHIPQLTIDVVEKSPVPVWDNWQILFDGVPVSDWQVAKMASQDWAVDLAETELEDRGTWVYMGMLIGAAGAVVSATGWVLYGQGSEHVADSVALGMGLGGLALSAGGVLWVTESIQRPVEPFLAPTPRHRLTRDQARQLVAAVNRRLWDEICLAKKAAP